MTGEATQVEKVLEDLIARLSKGATTPEIKAALIEAKRLRTVTTRWSAIPPQPDARREMMARVMDLIARTGLSERDLKGTEPPPRRAAVADASPVPPPVRPSVPPPRPSAPPARPSAPPPRPSGPAVLASPPAQAKREDLPPTASFRQYEELGQTRPRPLRTPMRPTREPPRSLPISQKPTVPPAPRVLGSPQDMFGPPSMEPPAKPSHERSISPLPERSISPLPHRPASPTTDRSANVERALVDRSLSPARGLPDRSLSPARPLERSMSPAAAWRSPASPPPPARTKSGQHVAVTAPRAREELGRNGDPTKRPLQTMQFNSGFLNDELLRQSDSPTKQHESLDSEPPPSRSKSTKPPPPPALTAPVPTTPRLGISTAPPPLRNRSPHRAATIAGIPEANEAMILAALNRPTVPIEEPFEEVAKRSSLPTVSPPPASSPSSAPAPESSPPDRKRGKETLMMGAYTAVEALKAVENARSPAMPADFDDGEEFEAPPSTKPSNPPESSGTPAVLGIGAPGHGSNHRIEGLSTKISRTNLAPVPPPRITQRPPPARREPTSQPLQQSQRVVVAPGISIVKPGTAAWQPHATLAGVSQKVVHRDPRTGFYAALVKLAPGATLPRRRHGRTEEIFVVSGLATIDGQPFEAGDYLRAEAETIHPAMTTKNGCTFYVIAGDDDEVIDEI